MGRLAYQLSEENKKRIDLLIAFGILNGGCPTKEELINECIHNYFVHVYTEYCGRADANDLMKRAMEESVRPPVS